MGTNKDKSLIFHLLRDGRISQKSLAKILRITPPSLNYRMEKLMEQGIIRGFSLFINPNVLNRYFMYLAFPNTHDVEYPEIFMKFRCLEEFNVYGVEGDLARIKELSEEMSNKLGKPLMSYFPPQSPRSLRPYERRLVRALFEEPRATPGEIARKLGASIRFVSNTIESLINRGEIRVIPEVDLARIDAFLIAVFSTNQQLGNIMSPCRVISVKSDTEGIEVCFVHDLREGKGLILKVREIDSKSKVMVVTDFTIRTSSFN
ncbi:Lrp/AsnC family transcriptional regulator [Metallosphaera sedula]|uniref:Lrp/AsnC family transcriptional regulator n=1 Tax=Metallosphaera sedula TaxID=43687 RepID=UPI00211375AE|nr:Lrp/AsnC family transcriptional regulator [Metallosphaera sedula]BBL46918.1 HTH-type transcriptional regulator Ptr2 [Metallosphaera sedula]